MIWLWNWLKNLLFQNYIFKDTNGFTHLEKKNIEAIIRDIVESIPAEWETRFCADIMVDILTSRIHNKIK